MTRNIFAVDVGRGTFRDGRARLYVRFSTQKLGFAEFEWTPAWLTPRQGVAELLREAVRVERSNRPGSTYLLEFAELARDILIEHAPPAEVKLLMGSLVRYHHEQSATEAPTVEVQVREWTGTRFWEHGRECWSLGVPLSDEAVRRLTDGKNYNWIVWNGEVIDIRAGEESLITTDGAARGTARR